jgi:hypothetical protein
MINTISIQKNTINVSKRIYYKNILYNKSNDIYFVSRALIFLYNFSQLRNTRIVIFFFTEGAVLRQSGLRRHSSAPELAPVCHGHDEIRRGWRGGGHGACCLWSPSSHSAWSLVSTHRDSIYSPRFARRLLRSLGLRSLCLSLASCWIESERGSG